MFLWGFIRDGIQHFGLFIVLTCTNLVALFFGIFFLENVNVKAKNNNKKIKKDISEEEDDELVSLLNEIKQKLETKEETLETYTDFKKRYYIYRVDDIVGYLQRDNTELDKLFKEEQKMFNDLKGQLTPEQQKSLSNYSDNWIYIINEEVEELTKQILNDFEEER